MRAGIVLCLFVALPVSLAQAEPPGTSLRPLARPFAAPDPAPAAQAPAVQAPAAQPNRALPRPKARPALTAPAAEEPATEEPAAEQPAPQTARVSGSMKGSVCKNPNLKGTALKPIKSKTKGCNVAAPISLTSVNGVRLNPAPTINCEAANALSDWVARGVQPAFGNQVVQMNVADSYSCRPRNNVRGNKISQHGSGNAIDISGFVLSTGKTLTVRSNYSGKIRKAHKAACGIFHTTLGPGSDGYHEDHLHLDVAPYRGRPYCR